MGSATAFLLQEAALLHRQGALAEAARRYQEVLHSEPANAEALYHLAVLACQQGRLQEGVELARRTLLIDPDRARCHNLLGMALSRQGRPEEALASFDRAIALEPDFSEAHGNRANVLSDLGRHEEALVAYDRAVTLNPGSIGDWFNRGAALHRLGRHAAALESYDRVLALQRDFPEAHFNRGNVLAHVQRNEEALASYERALALNLRLADALVNRGDVLLRLGRPTDALASFEAAIAAAPNHVGALVNRGMALSRLQRLAEAVASYEQALARDADHFEARCNLGNALLAQERAGEAAVHYRHALHVKPDAEAALIGLAKALIAQEDMAGALPAIVRAIELAPSDDTKALFVACVKYRKFRSEMPGLRGLLVRALEEPWDRPSDLAYAAASVVKLDPAIADCCRRAASAWPQRLSAESLMGSAGVAAIVQDRLLRILLESAPIVDIELERLLTGMRRILLDLAVTRAAATSFDEGLLEFSCALARQCFINEYVFDCTAEESDQLLLLRKQLIAAVASGKEVPAATLVMIAAYGPLGALAEADTLARPSWPPPIAALLVQQVVEPREEQSCRGAIVQLTAISNAVSRKVKDQYEENPYPRWVRVAPPGPPLSIEDYFGAWYQRRSGGGPRERFDMLVAGCGTGQSLIETAQQLKSADLLAVDLSVASLCYAMRQAKAVGLGNITFGEADILELGALGRTFDAIEAAGVLHHLADPWAGWRVLLTLLRPGGFMRIGLYSELARADINAARALVAARGYSPTPQDIRRSRQDILNLPDDAPEKEVSKHSDFFTISECRDVLFHAQEHQMTLPDIASFIAQNGLEFLGFTLDAHVLHRFKARFPQEDAPTDLALWHRFETDNPDTFAGMYQFWLRKKE
jgi:tetratricopeptide (TPR) repeat protein/SAM-dependent methyltransferase